jgi:predicted histone-like DNA-binding protein
MRYKLIVKSNPQNPEGLKKWYANAKKTGTMDIKEIAKIIAGRSSLTVGDVINVLSNFVDSLPMFLKLGMSIQLGDFGTLRLTISSEGVDNKDEFTVANIKGVRVVFTPSVELKNALKDIHFEEEK